MKDSYRYYILAYEDARRRRPIKHEHGGTTVLTDGAEALGRAEVLAREYPEGVGLHPRRVQRGVDGDRGGDVGGWNFHNEITSLPAWTA